MKYGEKDGAIGYLVGEENRGLNVMFIMMNAARLAVGTQGVSVAERATQRAIRLRPGAPAGSCGVEQGRRHGAHHRARRHPPQPDDHDGADAGGARHLPRHGQGDGRGRGAPRTPASARPRPIASALLTPIAKAFSTDIGCEVASIGVQVHGGMGFIEETGAAQIYRDARILPIYEGTNGIQAIDLVARKLPLEGGKVVEGYIGELQKTVEEVRASNRPEFGRMGERLGEAVAALAEASRWMGGALQKNPDAALAGATPYSAAVRARLGRHLSGARRAGRGAQRRPDAADRDCPLLCREHRHRRAGLEGHRRSAAPTPP